MDKARQVTSNTCFCMTWNTALLREFPVAETIASTPPHQPRCVSRTPKKQSQPFVKKQNSPPSDFVYYKKWHEWKSNSSSRFLIIIQRARREKEWRRSKKIKKTVWSLGTLKQRRKIFLSLMSDILFFFLLKAFNFVGLNSPFWCLGKYKCHQLFNLTWVVWGCLYASRKVNSTKSTKILQHASFGWFTANSHKAGQMHFWC